MRRRGFPLTVGILECNETTTMNLEFGLMRQLVANCRCCWPVRCNLLPLREPAHVLFSLVPTESDMSRQSVASFVFMWLREHNRLKLRPRPVIQYFFFYWSSRPPSLRERRIGAVEQIHCNLRAETLPLKSTRSLRTAVLHSLQ